MVMDAGARYWKLHHPFEVGGGIGLLNRGPHCIAAPSLAEFVITDAAETGFASALVVLVLTLKPLREIP